MTDWSGWSAVVVAAAVGAPSGATQDRPLGLRFEREVSIGASDPEFPSSIDPRDVAADSAGRIVVLDRDRGRVLLYDRAGKFVQRIGRPGRGPGSLVAPTAIATLGGSIWVYDAQQWALVGYDRDGLPLPPKALSKVGRVEAFAARGRDDFVVLTLNQDTVRLGLLLRRGVAVIEKLALVGEKPIDAGGCDIGPYGARPIFTPEVSFAVDRSLLVVNQNGGATIGSVDGNRRGRSVQRSLRRRRATTELAIASLGKGFRARVPGKTTCNVPAGTVVSAVGIADSVPIYRRLLMAPGRKIWAVRYVIPGEPATVDVFRLDRGYLGSASLGRVNPVAIEADGRVVSLESDDAGRPIIVIYRVRESKK